MKRIIPLLLAMLTMAGCGCFNGVDKPGVFIDGVPNSCGSTGYTFAGIAYGDSYLIGFPYSVVAAGAEFRLVIEPITVDAAHLTDLENRTVQIEGKSAGAEDDWLNASGVHSVSETIVICIPDDTPSGDYAYLVHVDGVGTLDPRVHVIKHSEN